MARTTAAENVVWVGEGQCSIVRTISTKVFIYLLLTGKMSSPPPHAPLMSVRTPHTHIPTDLSALVMHSESADTYLPYHTAHTHPAKGNIAICQLQRQFVRGAKVTPHFFRCSKEVIPSLSTN